MEVQSVSLFFPLSVLTVKSWMPMYLYILMIWISCFNTSVTGQKVIGSSVLAIEGDNVILPCHIKPSVDMTGWTVEWTRHDLEPNLVYLLKDGHVNTNIVNPLYKQRTSLFREELSHGNISLKLFRVNLTDDGIYTCFAPYQQSSSLIRLLVGSVFQPVISSNGPTDGGVSLRCDSGCWFPEPEMSWLASDRTVIRAGPSVTERRPPYCYVVQRDVMVWTAGLVTCRVHLTHINHTVETQRYISDDMIFTETSWFLHYFVPGICGAVVAVVVGSILTMNLLLTKKQTSGSHFVDQHQEELIQRVTKVNPILDLLLAERVITREGYSELMLKVTNQEKMSLLYSLLRSKRAKYVFYKGLEEHEKILLADLKSEGADPNLAPESNAVSLLLHQPTSPDLERGPSAL